MDPQFDPYHRWLSIPPNDQPPNHYRLLGVSTFESDAEVIALAADRQMSHVKSHAAGKYVEHSQKLLNEIARAKVCLLKSASKTAYDAELRGSSDTVAAPRAILATPRADAISGDGAEGPTTVEKHQAEALPHPPERPTADGRSTRNVFLQLPSTKRLVGAVVAAVVAALVIVAVGRLFSDGEPPTVAAPSGDGSGERFDPLPPRPAPPHRAVPKFPNKPPAHSPPIPVPPQTTIDRPSPRLPVAVPPPRIYSYEELQSLFCTIEYAPSDISSYGRVVGQYSVNSRFEDRARGILTALKSTVETIDGRPQIRSIQAGEFISPGEVYWLPPHGRRVGEAFEFVARAGFAIGGFNVSVAEDTASDRESATISTRRSARRKYVDGLQVVFMRVTPGGFDTKNTYTSPWVGNGANENALSVATIGRPVIGPPVIGIKGNLVERLDSIGVASTRYHRTTLDETPMLPPRWNDFFQGGGSLISTREACSDEVVDQVAERHKGPELKFATEIAGNSQGRIADHSGFGLLGGMHLRLSDSNEGMLVSGMEALFRRPGSASMYRYSHYRIFEQHAPPGVDYEIAAREGYAIGGIRVAGTDRVRAVQAIYMRITPSGLDADVTYRSDWIGDPGGAPVQTLVGDGRPVIGLKLVYDDNFHLTGLAAVYLASSFADRLAAQQAGKEFKRPQNSEGFIRVVPAEQELAKAIDSIHEIFRDELSAARASGDSAGVAGKLVKTAETTPNDVERFALYRVGLDLCSRSAAHLDEAWNVAHRLSNEYEIDRTALRVEAAEQAFQAALSAADYTGLIRHFLTLAKDAEHMDAYDEALDYIGRAGACAAKAKNTSMMKSLDQRRTELRIARREFQTMQAVLSKLELDPDDGEANQAYGVMRFFARRQPDGLDYLAKAQHSRLADAARLEMSRRSGAKVDHEELGDAWADAAEALEQDVHRWQCLSLAISAYRTAARGETGLHRAKLDRRIEQISNMRTRLQ